MATEGPQGVPGSTPGGPKPPRALFSSPVFRVQNGSVTPLQTPPTGPRGPRVSCMISPSGGPAPDIFKTPSKLRIDGGDLKTIEAALAQFRACPPTSEHMGRLCAPAPIGCPPRVPRPAQLRLTTGGGTNRCDAVAPAPAQRRAWDQTTRPIARCNRA